MMGRKETDLQTPAHLKVVSPLAFPHLDSWEDSLSQRIAEKEGQIADLKVRIATAQSDADAQSAKVDAIRDDITHTITKVETASAKFVASLKECLEYERSAETNLAQRGENIFAAFRKMNAHSEIFFSKTEYCPETCAIREKPSPPSWLELIRQKICQETEKTAWLGWMNPIWSLEDHFKNELTDYTEAESIHAAKLSVVRKLESDLCMFSNDLAGLRHERSALESFASSLTR